MMLNICMLNRWESPRACYAAETITENHQWAILDFLMTHYPKHQHPTLKPFLSISDHTNSTARVIFQDWLPLNMSRDALDELTFSIWNRAQSPTIPDPQKSECSLS